MKSRVKYRKYKSYKSGLLLLGILVISWFLITGINNSGIPAGLASLINADYENFRNLKQLDSATVDEVRGRIAGLWVYEYGDETSPVSKREYMEMIGNGIMWVVRVWGLRTPDGAAHKITHVATAFLSPYSESPDGSGYYCETRIIRQAYIFGGDTCYGASQVDEIWEIGLRENGGTGAGAENNRAFTLNRREYRPYTGDTKNFYPDINLLAMIDKIELSACPAAANFSWLSKKILARSMDAVPFVARAGIVDSLIRSYYKPLVLDELARRYDPRAVPDVMDVRMTISPEGTVTGLKYRGAKVVNKRFDDLAVPDMKGWLFPATGDSKEPQTLDIKVRVK
jgi:hypothetical protein